MEKFFFKARSPNGSLVREAVEASGLKEAKQKISQRGLTLIDVSGKEPFSFRLEGLRQGVSASELLAFNRQFQIIYAVGMPLLRGLALIEVQTRNLSLREALKNIIADVNNGQTLHDAFGKHPKIFDQAYINLLRVGESSGRLSQVLDRISSFSEERVQNQEKIKSATLYPRIVMVAFALVFIVVVYFVIPRIKSFFDQFNTPLPAITRAVLGFADFFNQYWYLALALAGGGTYRFIKFKNSSKGRAALDALYLKIPVLGSLICQIETKTFCATLELLMAGGVPILQSLALTKASLKNTLFRKEVDQCIAHIDNGGNMTDMFQKSKILPPLVVGLLAVGEETGELERVLKSVGSYYQTQINHRLDNLAKALEPALLFLVFFGVLVLALALYLPLWRMSSVLRH